MEGAAHVDRDDGVPALNGEVLDSGHVLDARVVHQNVDAAKLGSGVFHHVFNFRRFAHVGPVVGHFHAECGDFGFRALDVAKAVEDDVGALLGQGFGDAKAYAAGGPGDECCFIF